MVVRVTGKGSAVVGCASSARRGITQVCVTDNQLTKGATTEYSLEKSLPAIVPLKIQGVTLWAYLDTGSRRNVRGAIEKLKLKPLGHLSCNFVTIYGVKKQSMPIFSVKLDSLDGQACKEVEITGSQMADFTTVKRQTLSELKAKYGHARDKQFYMTVNEE